MIDVEKKSRRNMFDCYIFKEGKEAVILTNEYESFSNIPEVRALAYWIMNNISDKLNTNSIKTEDVLVRIATGMINKLPVCQINKDFFYENLINYRQIARREWILHALTASNEVPF